MPATVLSRPGRPARPAHARRTGRSTLVVGGALIVVGLLLMGYVGWQFYGSTWVSQRRHQQTVEQLQELWRQPPGTADPAEAPPSGADAIIRIPRLGADYAVPVIEGVDDDALAGGMGHFPGAAEAGGVGNYALAGHRVTHGEPLRAMPELEVGDEVVVETRDATYTYVLDTAGDALNVSFDQTWVVDPRPVNPDPAGTGPSTGSQQLITLTTCAELFHTDDRLVAFGHLVRSVPR